jgi:hypothetical protein
MIKQLLQSLGLLTIIVLVSGCMNAQTNLSLYGNEQWSGVQAIQIAPEMVAMMEESGEDSTVDTADIDEWLSNAEQAGIRDDIQVSFNEVKGEDGSQSYVLSASGTGYQSLNEIFFEGTANITTETVNGQKQVTINYMFSDSSAEDQDLSPEEQAMQAEMMKSMGLGISFRISGGEIINSNATRVDGNTAIWETPTEINITLTEAPSFNPDTIALVPPAADSGFSEATLEALMGAMAEDMAVADSSDASSSGTSTESATSGDNRSETTATDQSETISEQPVTSADPETTDNVTLLASDSDEAASPTDTEANLPSSGGELTPQESPIILLLGLIFIIIIGGSAIVGLKRRDLT